MTLMTLVAVDAAAVRGRRFEVHVVRTQRSRTSRAAALQLVSGETGIEKMLLDTAAFRFDD